MDQLAIISDIHGNMPALEVTLEDIRRRGITEIYCLGDLAGKGPESDDTVDACRDVCTGIVRGNWDELLGEPSEKEADIWQRNLLGPERLDYLKTLPGTLDLTISGHHVRLYHASQESPHHRVYYWDSFEKLKAMFENTSFTGNPGTTPQLVLYGDIHEAFMLPVVGKRLVNAGSVGNPTDGIAMASYIIVKGRLDSTQYTPIDIEFVRLPYDLEHAVEIARGVQMPKLAEYAFELRHGRYRRRMPEGYTP